MNFVNACLYVCNRARGVLEMCKTLHQVSGCEPREPRLLALRPWLPSCTDVGICNAVFRVVHSGGVYKATFS